MKLRYKISTLLLVTAVTALFMASITRGRVGRLEVWMTRAEFLKVVVDLGLKEAPPPLYRVEVVGVNYDRTYWITPHDGRIVEAAFELYGPGDELVELYVNWKRVATLEISTTKGIVKSETELSEKQLSHQRKMGGKF